MWTSVGAMMYMLVDSLFIERMKSNHSQWRFVVIDSALWGGVCSACRSPGQHRRQWPSLNQHCVFDSSRKILLMLHFTIEIKSQIDKVEQDE